MGRSAADSARGSISVGRKVKMLSLLCFSSFILFQLTTGTPSGIVPLPGHRLHGHQTPGAPYSPVRWTKSPHSSRQARPVDVMTDVINDLCVRILDRFLDRTGNVAFSPSGLGFVLVALYEGAAGTSGREIGDVLGLPRDRRITRIGLRDIHRILRSYLNADAFLGGLTLNRDDINLRPEYEEILRFYGFDISDSGLDNDTTTQNARTDSADPSARTDSTMTADSTVATDSTDATTEQSATATIPDSTELNDAVEVVTNLTDGTNSAMLAGTDGPSPTVPVTTTTLAPAIPDPDASGANPTSLTNPVTSPMPTESTSTGGTPSASSAAISANVQTLPNSTDGSDTIGPSANFVSVADELGSTRAESFDGSIAPPTNPAMPTTMNSNRAPSSPASASKVSASFNDTAGNSTVTRMRNSTIDAVEDAVRNAVRKRRGILHGPGGYFSSSADDGIWLNEFGRFNGRDDYPDEDIVVSPRRPIDVAFLVNGCVYSRVTAAAYTANMPFSYFPSLRASLLEFPLDDPRYKILIALPSDDNGTRRLARLLATKQVTLRHLRRSLRPTWVTAVIPSFMLRGFVTLTPYLQRLGISDVFDPRAADLTPMSPDLGVYARDIQQSIGVNIRNNAKGGIGGADGGNEEKIQQPQQRNDLVRKGRGAHGPPPFFLSAAGISLTPYGSPRYPSHPVAGNPLYERASPVPFVVDRPFLYFIIDDETSVALLAGRIDDPLNSRML